MSRKIGDVKNILAQNGADIAAANATWHSIEGCDQVMFNIVFDASTIATVTLDFGLYNNNTVVQQASYTGNNTVVLDDPMGKVRAWSSGIGAAEGANITMRRIWFNGR